MTSKNKRHNNVLSLTVSAMVSALSVTVLYLGSVIEVLDLTMALVASLLITFVYTEIGDRWEWLSYAVTGLLSALLFQNKFIAAVYILFAGNLSYAQIRDRAYTEKNGAMDIEARSLQCGVYPDFCCIKICLYDCRCRVHAQYTCISFLQHGFRTLRCGARQSDSIL